MNQINNYIFNFYHYYLNFRDSMEYAIQRDHSIKIFESRKNVLVNGLKEGTALGNFLKNNGENGEKLKEKILEAVNDLYEKDSTVLVPNGDIVRVDHTQHLKIFEYVVNVGQTLRDIIYQYMGQARKNNEAEYLISNLIKYDEKMYRIVATQLIMIDFQKSFSEFQKVMNESKGQPTPQSNFIVNNEIMKYTGLIRFVRSQARCTDNETLDLMDYCLKIIEMTEGRRDRIDDKPFGYFFEDVNKQLVDYIKKIEPLWKEAYESALKEVINKQKENESVPTDTNLN